VNSALLATDNVTMIMMMDDNVDDDDDIAKRATMYVACHKTSSALTYVSRY